MAQACEETRLHESRYVERRKELLSLVNQLHSIGAQDVIDLPRITVIGKQSAGKSSVVEAISGIKVPRDAGTCTRCPLECRLQSTSPDTPWSCQVFIRWEYITNGSNARNPEVKFGEVISDKSKVEERLRRAQFACLHPLRSLEQVLSMKEDELKGAGTVNGGQETALFGKKKVNFSRNVICVDIQGPGLPDLSFIDLPGLIQNAEPEDVQLVEDLVMSNIQGNCLILVAMPVTDDIENQKALRLAQRVDPLGRRTIGVLTKPDLLAPSSTNARQMWIDIIEGRKHTLKHGYYCVRQPDDSEREAGITRNGAREAEERFFTSNELWSNLTERTRRRLGTDGLIDMVGELLVQVINESLPRIRAEASKNLEHCKRDIQALPPVLDTDPSTYMLKVITSLTNDFLELVRGGPDNSQLIHGNREAFEAFRTRIRGTSPQFVPKPYSDKPGSGVWRANVNCEELVWNGEGFTLVDMKRHIERSVTRELRGNVPYQAKVSLIVAYQKHWPNHMLECYNHVRTSLAKALDDCVQRNFKQHERVLEPLRAYVDELIKAQYKKCSEFLEASLETERAPFTQNDHYLDSSTEKWLAKYRDERAGAKLQGKSNEIPAMNGSKANLTSTTGAKSNAPTGTQPGASSFSPQPQPASQFPTFGKPNDPHPPVSSGPGGPLGSNIFSATPTKPSEKNNGPVSDFSGKTTTTSTDTPASHPFVVPQKPFWDTPTAEKSPAGFGYKSPQPQKDQVKVKEALAVLASIGYTGLTEEDLGKLNPVDEYETELKVMAEVRGYFQVSYKRIIDNIPSLIDLKFVRAIGKELQPFLISKFELGTTNGNNRCAVYLAEDPDVSEKREQLLVRKKRLENVQAELFNFGL